MKRKSNTSAALESVDIQPLYDGIAEIISAARARVAVTVNAEVVLLNWRVGDFINRFILDGNRASYGGQIIDTLANQLTTEFGSGWSAKQIRHCLRLAETFSETQIVSAVQRQLSWTHLKTLAYENDPVKRDFYLEMAVSQRWNTRTLAEQMDKMLFERTAIATKPEDQVKEAVSQLAQDNLLSPELVFKSSYILDFLGLKNTYSEKELETAIIANIQEFILELGAGFAFLERQKRISIDAVDYYLDLLFFHRKLRRLVAIDLKLGKFKPEHKAQMELYLRYLQRYEMQDGENPPIGLLLCSEGNTEHIELLMLDEKEIKVAQYLTELPSKQWFADKLHRALAIAKINSPDK